MTTQTKRKNGKFIILGLIAVVALGLLAAKIIVENKIKAWATEDLSLYEPLLKLESAKVEASYLGASVTYKDVVYSMPDVPKVRFTIDKLSQEGLDGDTLMGKPGEASTIDKVVMSGFRMFVEGAEQPVMEMGYYEVSDMAFPYRDIRAALMANKGNPDMTGLFKSMTPIMEKAQMKSGASLMRDFKINARQLEIFDIYLGEVTSSGFRELSQETDGFDAALDESVCRNLQITAGMPDGSELLSTLESIELKGLKYNYKEMMAALGQFSERSDPISMLMAIIPSLYNYKFDSLALNKLMVSASGGVFTLDSIYLGPRTLKEQGPNVVRGMKAVFGGMEVFNLEAMGLDKLILSDVIVDFINRPNVYINDPNLLADISENPFMVLDGIKLENLFVKNLNANGMVKLDNWSTDVDIQNNVKIASRLDKLYVSPIGLRQAAMFTRDRAMTDILGVLAMNPDGLLIDGTMLTALGIDADYITYDADLGMQAAGQGSLVLKVNGITDEPKYDFEPYGDPMLGSLEISVTDAGVLDNVFSYMAAEGGAGSPEAARAALIQEINSEIPSSSINEGNLLQGIITFIQQGGTLDVVINPTEPILFNDLDLSGGSGGIGLSVTNSN